MADYSKDEKKKISAKIAYLVRNEGKTPKQASGQAYEMAKAKKK
tara:strand:- start:996 stop:1127 length:132 start_codon:yes stop_codon:yes gene_type:complete